MIRKVSFFQRRDEKSSPFTAKRVYKVQPALELLQTTARSRIVRKIKHLSKAPEIYYKSLYEPLIEQVAAYLQQLPDSRTLDIADSALWLDAALARTAYAMALRHRMTIPNDVDKEEVQQDYALWTYVIFSSSLLWQIGKLNTHYLISLCDDKGIVSKQWCPLTQPMTLAGEHYKIRSISQSGPETFKQITTVLAQKLMPHDGFEWIAGHDKALQAWLLALVEESGAQGSIIQVLELARAIFDNHPDFASFMKHLDAVEADLDKLQEELLELEDIEKKLREGADLPIDVTTAPDTEMGEEFLEWLQRGIRDKSIDYNSEKANVHVSPDGVVLAHPEIFQDFCEMFYRNRDWIIVYKQFNLLGLSKKSGSDTWFGKFFLDMDKVELAGSTISGGQQSKRRAFKGLLVNDKRTLFGNSQVKNSASLRHLTYGAEQTVNQNAAKYPILSQARQHAGFDKKK